MNRRVKRVIFWLVVIVVLVVLFRVLNFLIHLSFSLILIIIAAILIWILYQANKSKWL